MTESLLFFLAVLLPMAGIISIPLLPSVLRSKANFVFVLSVAIVTSIPAVKALTGNAVDLLVANTHVFGKISFHIDSLSSWFILIINLTCINGAFYGIGYMKPYQEQKANLSLHWILFLAVSIFNALGLYGAKWAGFPDCMGTDVHFLFSACHL